MQRFFLSATVVVALASASIAVGSTAKVRSFSCGSRDHMRHGSGYALLHSGQPYVLTSSHVVFHNNGGLIGGCHEATLDGETHQLRLVAVDTLLGAALLAPVADMKPGGLSALDETAEMLDQWQAAQNQVGSAGRALPAGLRFEGFRYNSNQKMVVRNVEFITRTGDTPILPSVEHTFEFVGHSEYGMSGGPVLTETNLFVAMLSHQYLEVVQGRVTSIGLHERASETRPSVADNARVVIVTLAIPAPLLVRWVAQQVPALSEVDISRYDFIPLGFGLDPRGQALGQASMNIDGLQLTEIGCTGSTAVGGGQGSGIGGQGSGIGGQGSGIGGSQPDNLASVLSAVGSTCRVKVIKNRYANQSWPFPETTFLDPVHAALTAHEKVYVAATKDLDGQYHGFGNLHMALARVRFRSHALVVVREDQLLPLPANKSIDAVPEMIPNSRCSCSYDEVSRNFLLIYRDLDGGSHIIDDGFASLQACARALPRVPLCQRKIVRQNICQCVAYANRPGVHLFKMGVSGRAVYLDSYEDQLGCEQFKASRHDCWRSR